MSQNKVLPDPAILVISMMKQNFEKEIQLNIDQLEQVTADNERLKKFVNQITDEYVCDELEILSCNLCKEYFYTLDDTNYHCQLCDKLTCP